MNKKFLMVALCASSLSAPAFAQPAPTEFPDGAIPLTAPALQAAVEDKVFMAQPAQGAAWRLQYNANGFFYVNVGNFSDDGKWSVKDSTLCTEGKRVKAFCNELRSKDGVLYMKRESGEILKLVQR